MQRSGPRIVIAMVEPDGGEQTLRPADRGSGGLLDGGSTEGFASPEDHKIDPLAFPVPGWDRYTSIRFLGKGGMGKVFLVHDPRLRREVALKFVRGDNPEHVRRLISEARAQARVSHERVCKVHEVDEVDGKVYIAMQYIAGQPLGALADQLTIEQRVMLVRDAAAGIHEAHRVGIIHRDLKPSNIMVERADDGQHRAYVMDFGLARSAQDDGATLSGTVIGTPRYMAPEQAIGAAGGLDRRADVYSLGATLYHLVTGKPSVEGSSLVEVVHNLVTVDPRPPRALNRDVPVDLEAIILKCLEKDRTARYDSARALVEDLQRFLDGEPVLARSAGAWYRLRKRVAKHRRIVAVSAAALVLSVIAVGWGALARGEAARREQLARRFTEMVEGIESKARYAALSPRHDLRVDQAELRHRMTELEREIRIAGEVAEGPGHYALGRGYLALGEDETARVELEHAWQRGFHEPRAADTLATVMGRLYHEHLLVAEQLPRELRAAKRREVERGFRDPALVYLLQSLGAGSGPPAYAAAQLLFYTDRLDDALHQLDAAGAGAGASSFYELPQLRGDILLARALQLRDQGKYKPALGELEASRVAYAAAAVIGRSVPVVYKSLAFVEYATLAIEIYSSGDAPGTFARGAAAIASALAILPDDYDALVLEASMHRAMAEHRSNGGVEVQDLLDKAIGDAARAVTLAPARWQAHQELSDCYRQWGEVRQRHSEDPGAQLGKAIAASDAIAVADRNARYYSSRGLIYQVWGDYEDQVGLDSQAHRTKAIDAYQRALQINPAWHQALGNLAATYTMRATQPQAKDPEGDLELAIQANRQAQALNTNDFIPFLNEGESYHLIAQLHRARGLDPAPMLARALEAYERGLEISKTSHHLHNAIGMVALEQAKDAWDHCGTPEPAFERARAAFTQSTTEAQEDGHGYDNLGELFVLRGRLAYAHGDDPTVEIRAAVGWMHTAIARLPDDAGFWTVLASAHVLGARYELEHGRDPEPRLREASAALDTAYQHNRNEPLAASLRGETLGIRAHYHAAQHQPFDFAPAVTAYQQAIELAPRNSEVRLDLGRLYDEWAAVLRTTQGDPEPALQHGLELATQLLAARPSWAAALVLRASLRLAEAEHAERPDVRRARAGEAAADFDQARSINCNLTPAWSRRAALARQLAER
jgi:eukaryotic-like serine/threonine-protein kinase